jgi:hypothetical protein
MHITRKNISLIIIVGILLYGLPSVTLCASYCGSRNLDPGSPVAGSCPISLHLFAQIAIALPALFVLSPAGFLLVRGRQFIPHGVYWPLLRPPRFSR